MKHLLCILLLFTNLCLSQTNHINLNKLQKKQIIELNLISTIVSYELIYLELIIQLWNLNLQLLICQKQLK